MATPEELFRKALERQRAGKLEEAAKIYGALLKVVPSQTDALNNLGVCLMELDRVNEALEVLSKGIEENPHDYELLNNLGNALQKSFRMEEAVTRFKEALKLKPENVTIQLNLSRNLLRLGEYDEALMHLENARAVAPDNAELALLDTLALPVIYASQKEMTIARSRLESKLTDLELREWELLDPVSSVGLTNFYLPYQGKNDIDIQTRVAALYMRSCPDLTFVANHCPFYCGPRGGRIRLGFVSALLGTHTIGKLFHGLIKALDPKQFEVLVFHLGPDHRGKDKHLGALSKQVDAFICLPSHYVQARETIAATRPDIIYYTDIGMEPLSYFLAFARLAPVQCASWGHPVTTGIPNIDYFLTWQIHEPQDAHFHYSEKLQVFSGFCTNYSRPAFANSPKGREALGLDTHATLYVCPQSLFKFHPKFDGMLARILRNDKRGQIILLEGQQQNWGRLLRARFEKSNPDVVDRINFLPRLSSEDFLHLITLADVVLDTPLFCGGNTSFEALAAGKVLVTLPGQYMRGLFTAGLYRHMGLEDLIPSTAEEYVELAVKLGTDVGERIKQEERIKDRTNLILNNAETVYSHQQFFQDALDEARNVTQHC